MKKIGTLILAIGLVLGFSSCKTETEEVTLEKIEITAQPSKTEYLVGEELDTTGLEVTATYSDESTKDVTAEATITGYDKEKAGEQTVEVSYTENEITQTAIFTVTVKEKTTEPGKEPGKEPGNEPGNKPGNEPGNEPPKVELTKIEITTDPAKTVYIVGEELDTKGMVVTATYSDNSTKDVTAYVKTEGFDSSALVESQTITVSYGGKTATFTIKILTLTKIEITTPPTKKEYTTGDTVFDLAGMKVTATYDDDSTKDVTAYVTTSGFDSRNTVKSQTITVTYGDQTATFTISILFNWYETPKQLPAEADGTYGTEGTYVYFGVWPQDVVPVEDVAGLALDEEAETTIARGYLKYVQGTDGSYYVKCAENACEPGYKYNKDNSDVGQSGTTTTYRWFKVMPIKWRVLTTDYNGTENALLLAENILTANVPYYVNSDLRTIETKEVYPNNYKYSTIRAYLNGFYESVYTQPKTYEDEGFLQTAFTKNAQDKIESTAVINNSNSTTDADSNLQKADKYICDTTEDKIFLLSEQEVTTSAYGFADYVSYGPGNTRVRVATDYAKANFAYQGRYLNEGGKWWLRSPCYYDYANSYKAYCIRYDGHPTDYNEGVIDNSYYGVVPALSIKLQ